jgi:pimeloyl-ACP methyl ester carboxylesterase
MSEEQFAVAVGDGVLAGHRGGDGPPALLLHGGPAWPDYTEGCARELDGLLATMRYTQRGVPPSTVGGPYTIESHTSDAVAVLDHFGIERAWAVGHSWGGHLALHLAVAHPDRLLGVICIDPLGAFERVFAEFGANLRAGISPEQGARIDAIEARRRAGEVSEADLVERSELVWPLYFADPATAARLPALFVHGERDPLPVSSSREAAALIPGAVVDTIPGCGHFPWMERTGEIRRRVAAFLE